MKKYFSNAWVIGILGSIIATFIISAITAIYKKINIIQAIKQLLTWVIAFLTFRIPLYIILIVIVCIAIAAKICIVVLTAKECEKPKWLKYTKTKYKNWFMTWEYHLNYDNKYNIENLRPICECGCELSNRESINNVYYSVGVLVCPKCENTYPPIDSNALEDFNKILIHDIKNEKYPNDL